MLDLKNYVFSRKGNYFLVDQNERGFVLASAYGGIRRDLYEICFEGRPEYEFLPWKFTVKCNQNVYNFVLAGKSGVLIEGSGGTITLKYIDKPNCYNINFLYRSDRGICLGDTLSNGKTYFMLQKGDISCDAPMNVGKESRQFYAKREYIHIRLSGSNGFLAAIEQCINTSPVLDGMNFETCAAESKTDFETFAEPLLKKNADYFGAAYVLWSNFAEQGGHFKRKPLLCSKAGMTRVWSWDNVFNALSLAEFHPEMALDQFMIPYDLMTESGQIPDCISSVTVEWTNVKPPVQGWAYSLMMQKHVFFRKKQTLVKVYHAIKRNTDWWLNQNGGMPVYYHGNDSGADNATCFDEADCIMSPDLFAFLALQCEFLANTAAEIGLAADHNYYSENQRRFTELAEQFFDGRVFVRDAYSGENYYSNALMPLRVLLLGMRLPQDMRTFIVGRLRKDFLSDYGLASEALNSPKYLKNGYWRGAIWSPDQYIFYEALMAVGEELLAKKVLNNYQNAVRKSGFYENYGAISGEGERTKNFCWPISTFLL